MRTWLIGLMAAALLGCGGGTTATGPAGSGASDEAGAGERGCVEERFAAPPQDQGLDPPPTTVRPGDVPLPDCPEEP